MDIEESQPTKKTGLSKGFIISIVAIILVIGGGVAAYVSMTNPSSAKGKYLLAEKNSIDLLTETVENRFESELAWAEQTEEKPTETSIELSAAYNDPFGGGMGLEGLDPADFINNSALKFTVQSDMKQKKLVTALAADVAGFEIDDIHLYLTAEELVLGLPFLNEKLQIKATDAGKLLHEAMPELVDADEEIDFGKIFDASNGYLSEEEIDHLKKEYLETVIKDLPDDAFTDESEKIDVNGDSIDAEKITLHLTEEQVINLLTSILDKLHKDEVVKGMIEEQFSNQMFGLTNAELILEDDSFDLIGDFEEGILEAKEEVKDLHIPDGFTSTIWVDDKLIVKRDLSIEMGPSEDDLVAFTIDGTQLLTDTHQVFSYDLGFKDAYDEGTMTIAGDLSWEDDQINDYIKLLIEGTEIAYEAEETLDKGDRSFDRAFILFDEYGDGGQLIWSGTSNYEKDQMNASHSFAVEADGIGQDLFSLHATIDGKQIKEVTIPDGPVKDIGSMSMDEIQVYFENDLSMQFQQWLMTEIMGAGGDFGF